MLFRLLDVLRQDPVAFVILLATIGLALLIAISVHEFSHALIAYWQGDDTAKNQGRLSLNPLVHLDPIGTLLLFIVGFGWGKPVPVNPYGLRRGPISGMALVSLAGPLSNLVAAGLFGLAAKLSGGVPDIISYIVFFNIILALFNLIPLPPLDGFKIALGILPPRLSYSFSKIEAYGPMLLVLVIVVDNFTNLGILSRILGPAVNFFGQLFLQQHLL